ncbi:MAG: AAA family ATPase, partial [Sulfolobales archaeon]
AKRKAPAIVFIDELDAIGAKRVDVGTSGEREIHRTLSQLLVEIDGFDPLDKVKIMAATNRVDIIDPALLRPGRFDRLIEVPPPDVTGRYEIFKIHTSKMALASDVDLWRLAKLSEGLCGADIKTICTEAGYNAIRRGAEAVNMNDFLMAIEKYLSGRHTSRKDQFNQRISI